MHTIPNPDDKTGIRLFPLGDILTVITGRVVTTNGIGALYELLDYMTGDRLFTHQLPRAMRECEPELLLMLKPDAQIVAVALHDSDGEPSS